MINHLHEQHLECTGCEACANACPVSAIHMEPDTLGFYEAKIDMEACIDCGRCREVCPVLNGFSSDHTDKPACYAAMAANCIREKSSSGGAFYALAKTILDNGGAVCGASMESGLSVQHILIDDAARLPKLQRSKCVQSRINSCYQQVRQRLERGQDVLFSGTPCQVAGLRGYLGKEYKKLFTVDLLCHGVPSQQMLRDSLCDYDNLIGVDFRDKEYGWDCTRITLLFQDGSKRNLTYNESRFEQGFHSSMILRESCFNCPFCDFPRQGDITIGDFWELDNQLPEINDGRGISIVLINSPGGQCLWSKASERLLHKITADLGPVLKSNRFFPKIDVPAERARFLELYPQYAFNKAVLYAQQDKHDIGIVGNWSYPNYGTALTYYALYRVLRDQGYSVTMLSWPRDSAWPPYEHPQLFSRLPYPPCDMAQLPDERQDLWQYNDRCSTFILGSDQLLNNNLYRSFSRFVQLDWVRSNRRKIAYATSFGTDYIWGSDDDRAELSHFLRQFDFVSVREESGKVILADLFGVDAQWVLDPIFLLSPEHYQTLISAGSRPIPTEPYLFAYLLDVKAEDRPALELWSQKVGLPICTVADAAPPEHQIKKTSAPASADGVYLEDWLSYISGSSFVLTDSFHGMCLAILLHKPFVALSNIARGAVRFQEILCRLGLEERLCGSLQELPEKLHLLDEPIDFDGVEQRLAHLRKDSLSWLKNALVQALPAKELTDYDLLAERCLNDEQAIRTLQSKCADTEKAAAIWWEQLEDHRLRLDGLDAQAADAVRLSREASVSDAEQWKQLEDHRLRLDGLDAQMADALRLSCEASNTDAEQWKQLEDHRQRLDGLDAQIADASRLSHEATTTDAEQWKQLEDHRLRLDGLDAQVADASRLGCEASTADAEQWKQLEDHRQRLDGLDAKIIESAVLVDATKAELSEQISRLKELIFVLEQQNAELQSEVKRLAESSLRSRLKKVFHQMMFWT